MRLIVTIMFVFMTRTESQKCNHENSVELVNGYFKGLKYEEDQYFVDNTTGVERGCVCMKETCTRKCCPFGEGYNKITKKCVNITEKFDPPVWEGSTLITEFNVTKEFHFLFNKMNCTSDLGTLRIPIRTSLVPFQLQTNGKLYVEVTKGSASIYGPDQYCIDTFVWDDNTTEISALICYSPPPQENHYQLSSTLMLISCFFIVLTVAVYAWLPELRNLHGMVLMAYLLSFLVGFTFMATMQIQIIKNEIPAEMCLSFTFIIYFSLLSAFFWLNIMCYDIWWTFSGKRSMSGGNSSPRVRFMYYSIYAFGIPLCLTILLAGLEFGVDNNLSQLLPRIRLQGCFLFGNSKLLYFYVPIVILCVANLVFFTLTALKIAAIKNQSQKVLNKKDKQRFSLYIKLFLVMGVNWILEVVSSFYPQADYIWKFTDAYNVLVGLIIFIIFVCKVKTLKMIRHRHGCYPWSVSIDTSYIQTAIVWVTMLIELKMRMVTITLGLHLLLSIRQSGVTLIPTTNGPATAV